MKNTWIRVGIFALSFLLLPALFICLCKITKSWNTDLFNQIILWLVLPAITILIASWDGVKAGFSALWLIYPMLVFPLTMLLFFDANKLIYGSLYGVLAAVASGIGSHFHTSGDASGANS